MKKTITLILAVFAVISTFAGGLVTNSNQSAQFVRMLSRNASWQIDAVYYNPAGLFKLNNGLNFGLYNQTIFQEKTVVSGFPGLNNGEYVGKVNAPFFPSAFAAYKTDRLAVSLGFGPIGGGGSADFDRGLPSFEIPFVALPGALAGLKQISPLYDVTGYDANISFEGSSIYLGFQGGLAYKLNDMVSVFAGARYNSAKNTYKGHIKDVSVLVAGNKVNAYSWFGETAGTLKGLSDQAKNAATLYDNASRSAQALVDAGAQNLTLAQVAGAGYITAEQKALFEQALANLKLTPDQIAAMRMYEIQGYYAQAQLNYQTVGTQLATASGGLTANQALVTDRSVDTKQTGSGITPIIGANFNLSDNFNIGIKYEFQTKLDLTNETTIDDTGLFPNGAVTSNDIPAMLAVGIGFRPASRLETQLSVNYYFDKNVEWGNNIRTKAVREIENNGYEVALGLQYDLTDNFALSLGGMSNKPGIADSYQSDFSYSNPSYTLGGGIQMKFNKLVFDAGLLNTFYQDAEVNYPAANPLPAYTETYKKSTFAFALGLSYSL